MSKAADLADAIVDFLNNASRDFSQVFDAERLATPIFTNEILETLSVVVYTGTRASERRARGRGRGDDGEFGHIYKPVVSVQKKIVPNSAETRKATADELLLLTEEIESAFEDRALLTGLETATSLTFIGFSEGQSERDSYDDLLLHQNGVFANWITLTFED